MSDDTSTCACCSNGTAMTVEEILAAQSDPKLGFTTLADGSIVSIPLEAAPQTVKVIYTQACDIIDAITAKRLTSGFQFPFGTYWRMNASDQSNWTTRFLMKDVLEYPISEPTLDRNVVKTFTQEELVKFFTAWIKYRDFYLAQGRKDKEALKSKTVTELMFYIRNNR